jgi:hypothetical protein
MLATHNLWTKWLEMVVEKVGAASLVVQCIFVLILLEIMSFVTFRT